MTDIARRFAELRSAVAAGTYTGPITKTGSSMAELPRTEDLDAMADLIAGLSFDQLGPEARIQVIGLVAQGDIIEELGHLKTALDDLYQPIDKIADWFRNSKVYYP